MKKLIPIIIIGIFLFGFLVSIFSINLVHAVGEVSYCCEKLDNGAWCQNAPKDSCDASFRAVPTSCESTSYCKLGTCIDSQEGTCQENTPEKVCEDNGGVWSAGKPEDIPQCSLGCCLIGDQAAFVTQTRCKRLSSLYGIEINFRTDISSEIQCIASATSEVKGACVFEKDFEKTCQFTTQKDCNDMGSANNGTDFYAGTLCSDESLGTNCGPSEKTICVDGKDEVYFVDTCGNLANIYDASKIKDKNYWSEVKNKDESCNPNSKNGNADSATCGNCDYYLGSTCKSYDRTEDKTKPNFGDNICRDLSCTYEGKVYQHGETWCANSAGTDKNLPGSRYYRMVCYNGEVSVEPCADFRQEVCIESDIDGFSTAACRVNMWQDCTAQDNKKDCENTDRRDCVWNPPSGTAVSKTRDNEKVSGNATACFPLNPPGFDFWNSEGDAQTLCSKASTQCIVTFEKGIIGGEKCTNNCECLTDAWANSHNQVCTSLGDCGSSVNYLGAEGYNKIDDAVSRSES